MPTCKGFSEKTNTTPTFILKKIHKRLFFKKIIINFVGVKPIKFTVMFWKTIKKVFFLALAFGLIIIFHHFTISKSDQPNKTADLKESISASYRAYSLSSFDAAKDKMVHYAESLYQKELAEGETDKEFKGFTVIKYCWKALDEYKDEINVQKELALFLPLIAVILIIIAIVVSIRLGLSAIRKLDFDNDATSF